MRGIPSNDSTGNSEKLNPVKGLQEHIATRIAEAGMNGEAFASAGKGEADDDPPSGKPRQSRRKAKPAAVNPDAEAKPDAPLRLVHETAMPDADEFADETGSAETDDENAARASALRAILINGLDAKSIEWRIKRQWPRLKDKIPEIIESAQRTAEKWKPGATRMIGGMLKRITSVDLLNERFVMVMVRGQASCIAQRSDALFLSRDDFSARLADSVIVIGVDKKGTPKAESAAKVWLGDCRRRFANEIVFTSRKVGPNCLNLWTGFGVTPQAGRCDLIYQHIREVICAGDPVAYEAFLNLLAWIVQNIGEPSRIVVTLQSREQQVGKGVLLEKVLYPIFGLHGIIIDESEHLFGRFNDAVRGKAFAFLDEANFAGDKKLADKIKSIVAKTKMTIEGKFVAAIACPVGLNLFLATNHEHAARVEWDDVRNWILKVSPRRKSDRDYWAALLKEIGNGGPAALLHDLLSRDISNFVPQRDVPFKNAEHRANQRASDPTNPALWLRDCLDSGLWMGSEGWQAPYAPDRPDKEFRGVLVIDEKDTRMLPAFLESSYRAWATAQGRHAQPAAKDDFWKQMSGFGFDRSSSNGKRYRFVPDEKQLRTKLTECLGSDGE
jgi:hypothetical protein